MPIAQAEREIVFSDAIRSGARGAPAKRVQEWLTFHGFATPVDSALGGATKRQVRTFQQANDLAANGVVGRSTWDALVVPLHQAVAPVTPKANDDVASMTPRNARQHFAVHPIEIGGDNRGHGCAPT